jgi:hypothetical protein
VEKSVFVIKKRKVDRIQDDTKRDGHGHGKGHGLESDGCAGRRLTLMT